MILCFNYLDKNSNNQTAQQTAAQQTPLTTTTANTSTTTPAVSLSENSTNSGKLQFYFSSPR